MNSFLALRALPDRLGSMRKRFVIAALASALIAGALVIWLAIPSPKAPDNPIIRGKLLSEWITEMEFGSNYATASSVLKEVGTNAIPFYLQMATAHDTPLESAWFSVASRQHFFKVKHTQPNDLNNASMAAFRQLGSNGWVAIPELIRAYDRAYSPNSQNVIAFILGDFGPPARAAIPSLLRETSNKVDFVRNSAYRALGGIHEDAPRAVPALIRGLNDTYDTSRYHSAQGLGNFGTNAHAAVPALVSFIKTNVPSSVSAAPPSPGMKSIAPRPSPSAGWSADAGQTALNSLRNIDPAAAAQLEAELRTNSSSPSSTSR